LAAAAILVSAAIVPDMDLLAGDHRGISHSLGMAVAAGAVAMAVSRRPRWGAAVALAWASHVLLDWMSNDTRPPLGVMAFWPLTREYYKASFEVFPAVSRRYWLAEFWVYNLKALMVELLILGPIAAAATWRRRGQTGVKPGSDPGLTPL
jgi:membrane-bound metal-dependent hydrolase YbcI (DUF457 family)